MDINFGEENNSTVVKDKVTISKQQRNGRKREVSVCRKNFCQQQSP